VLHLTQFVAVICCAIFAGAAIYINFVEHPARMSRGTQIAAVVWAPSYKRATVMQAPLAVVSCLAGILTWLLGGGSIWLAGAVLIGLVVPFTLIVILPTNQKLLEPGRDLDSTETRTLLIKWNRLHAVRSVLSLLALVIYLILLIQVRHAGTLPKGEDPMTTTMTRTQEKTTTYQVRHISVPINRPPDEVYVFVSNPENVPKWATGLGGSIKKVNNEWIADSPMGKVKVKFAEQNKFGVLDHEVTLESGVRINNPMRVIANGKGSEVFFTLIRQPGTSDEKFEKDAQWVEKDLKILKGLLEKGL
jgi:hypothetical protein